MTNAFKSVDIAKTLEAITRTLVRARPVNYGYAD
ncbi:hypothetical protein BBC0178_016190 [Bartonella apihabitans]|uniref:Uncharacterized protein n=1 Tax=Bartonella apihabitans TaxID=2750929 RepID=A0A1U9MCP2_9HYPH|nr:hypothetical protein BBC0178_016190 [Bartonella apihabitans]